MEGGLSLIAVKNAYVARQACVQRESELVRGNAALCVEMGDLRKRMYAAVSPARSMQCAPFACKLGELAFNGLLYRRIRLSAVSAALNTSFVFMDYTARRRI